MSTYILVATDFFESAVLVNERSAVFLPLRGQIHHPLGTGLHLILEEGAHRFHQIWIRHVCICQRCASALLPEASAGCCLRLVAGRSFSSSPASSPLRQSFSALAASTHPTPATYHTWSVNHPCSLCSFRTHGCCCCRYYSFNQWICPCVTLQVFHITNTLNKWPVVSVAYNN